MTDHASQNFHDDLVVLPFSVRLSSGELALFLNVQKILRVDEASAVTPLVEILPPFTGMYDYEGLPVAVLDLGTLLETSARKAGTSRLPETIRGEGRVVICEAMGRLVGLVVRQTRKISRFPTANIQPPPQVWRDLDMTYVCAMIKEPEGFRYMLDVEAVLAALGVKFEAPSGQGGNALAGKRVLLVEDSRVFQTLARSALRKEGAVVDVASDGAEGLERVLSKDDRYDLVVLDIEMPVMNGLEMARRYRAQTDDPTPILFHSAITNPVLADDILKEGLGEYIPKFEEDAIIRKLKSMIK